MYDTYSPTQKVNVNQKPSIMATSEIHNLEF